MPMKSMSTYSVTKSSVWRNFFIIGWLTATAGCTQSVSKEKQNADVRAVVQEAFSNKWLARFINNPQSGRIVFRYEELPIHNGHTLPKPTFNVTLSNQKVIAYTVSNREESNALPVLIEQVIINHDSAILNLRIPKQWVYGEFRFGKTATGNWVVTKDNVFEE